MDIIFPLFCAVAMTIAMWFVSDAETFPLPYYDHPAISIHCVPVELCLQDFVSVFHLHFKL